LKNLFHLFSLLLTLLILIACSSNSSLELIDAEVSIVNDEKMVGSTEITEGKRKGEKLVPTALYYEFTIKNTANQTVGSEKANTVIQLKIEPKDRLKSASENVIGFNIFNPEAYDASGLGFEETYTVILSSDQKARYTLYFDLGVSKENPNVPLIVPPNDQLDELMMEALSAFLVITIEDEEIARFDLEK
jgi:ABC-type Fe3+-hydroxamate transport system substrate-binding protein